MKEEMMEALLKTFDRIRELESESFDTRDKVFNCRTLLNNLLDDNKLDPDAIHTIQTVIENLEEIIYSI